MVEKYDKNSLALLDTVSFDLVADDIKLKTLVKVLLVDTKIIVLAASKADGKQVIYGLILSLESKKVESTKLLFCRKLDGGINNYQDETIEALSCMYKNRFFLISYTTAGKNVWYSNQLGFHLFDIDLNLG